MEIQNIETSCGVFYTDGSAFPNPGNIGWGLHGYIYDDSVKKGVTKNKLTKYAITDKGYLEPGVLNRVPHELVNPVYYVDGYGSFESESTNNVAEILGLVNALIFSVKNMLNKTTVYTDSTYVLHIVNTLQDSLGDNQQLISNVSKNREYWKLIEKLLIECKESGMEVVTLKVAAHSTNIGNNIADRLAFLGREKSIQTDKDDVVIKVSKNTGYWKPKIERHPLLQFKQIFYHTNVANNLPIYNVINYSEENEIGKRDMAGSYGVVVLKEGLKELTQVAETMSKITGNLSTIATTRLDVLYSPNVYRLYNNFGEDIFHVKGKHRKFVTILESATVDEPSVSDTIIANEVTPPGRASKALENCGLLKQFISDYVKIKENPQHKSYAEFVDVTLNFFISDGKKTVLSPNILSTNKEETVEYDFNGMKVKIPLLFGKDIITRNSLKKLEKLDTKVTLVVLRNGDLKLDYFTIIECCKTGDIGCYASWYSNKIFLKGQI